jgi:hypothetical protein
MYVNERIMVRFMSKVKMMSKLGNVVGTISKRLSIVSASVVEVINNGKLDFIAGYTQAYELESSNDIEKKVEILEDFENSATFMNKVGFITYKTLRNLKDIIETMRTWYKNKLTVITEDGSLKEHASAVSNRISHITSVITHSLCVFVSTLLFGFTSLITLGLCTSLFYELYIG